MTLLWPNDMPPIYLPSFLYLIRRLRILGRIKKLGS